MQMLKKFLPTAMLLLALLALGGCASNRLDRGSALDAAQYAWSAAIRWGDFEGAWNLLDPAYRATHPLSDVDLEHYKQLQISGYEVLGAQATADSAMREIHIGVINRNTLVERDVRYTERWHYDAASKSWWVVGGLPDLWQAP